MRRNTVNDSYFAIPNLENSYWAGFLAADGNISNNRPELTLLLSEIDRHHLAEFKSALSLEANIKERLGKNGTKYPVIRFTSEQMVKDLNSNFNITPRKSLMLEPPDLSGDNALAFIKGYIDGDGSIALYARPGNRRKLFRISIKGTFGMLKWVKSVFDLYGNSKANPIKDSPSAAYPISKIYRYDVRKFEHSLKIFGLLKDLKTPSLLRKWRYDVNTLKKEVLT